MMETLFLFFVTSLHHKITHSKRLDLKYSDSIQGAAYVFERFLDARGSEMAQDMSMKFFTTISYCV